MLSIHYSTRRRDQVHVKMREASLSMGAHVLTKRGSCEPRSRGHCCGKAATNRLFGLVNPLFSIVNFLLFQLFFYYRPLLFSIILRGGTNLKSGLSLNHCLNPRSDY